jgi:hypothetical protein
MKGTDNPLNRERNSKMPIAAIVNAIEVMEITEEEKQMIEAKRREEAHDRLRHDYIDELLSVIKRARADGFVISAKSSGAITIVKDWGDAAGNYIAID